MRKFRIEYFKLENDKKPFIEWLYSLDNSVKTRVFVRLERIQQGNLGDFKKLNDSLYELRLNYGKGYRIYYTIENNTIILLLSGGDKSTQPKDIAKAKEYIQILKGLKNE